MDIINKNNGNTRHPPPPETCLLFGLLDAEVSSALLRDSYMRCGELSLSLSIVDKI
jgi:hypothetical protein